MMEIMFAKLNSAIESSKSPWNVEDILEELCTSFRRREDV